MQSKKILKKKDDNRFNVKNFIEKIHQKCR